MARVVVGVVVRRGTDSLPPATGCSARSRRGERPHRGVPQGGTPTRTNSATARRGKCRSCAREQKEIADLLDRLTQPPDDEPRDPEKEKEANP
ncbi:MAG: hypothetical protein U0736_17170 [Gemmataceae bacterium]